MQTRFTRLVGCAVPIQQAAMGTVSSPDLAVAVADAGGVGTVTTLWAESRSFLRRLADMRARTDGDLAANVLLPGLDPGYLREVAALVRILDFFWFDPQPRLVEVAHEAGALAGWQVGSVDEARAAVDAGCDLVTAQGVEAGGHDRGTTPLRELLPAVLDAVDVPVLAAGGISDGAAFAEVLRAGADGARIGTRFLATTESGAHPAYKQAVVDAGDDATVVTDAFADCPLCATSPRARILRSAVEHVRQIQDDVVATSARGPVPPHSGLPPTVDVEGHVEAMALYAGAGVGRVHDVRPAADVVAELMRAV